MPHAKKSVRYESDAKILGVPLLAVAKGPSGGERRGHARGIIAVGDHATGVVAIGGVSHGLISVGGIALGGVAIGGLVMGGVAIGAVAYGGVAIGYHAEGRKTVRQKSFATLPSAW